ncbi:MAG: DUF481 domain-containing protein [Limnobacter sp.]|nr:DUF481 domain-containing protein [Limnobacter sp.]
MNEISRRNQILPWFKASALAILVSISSLAGAAKVTLVNGDRLNGSIVKMTDGTLIFKSDIFGQIKIPFDQVSSLQSDANTTIALKDGSKAVGSVEMDEQGTVSITDSKVAQSQGLTRADVVAFNPPVRTGKTKYSGRANLGGTFNRGNSDEDTLNLDAELVARTIDSRYTLAAEVNEGSAAGVTTTSNRLLSAKYDAFLNEKDYMFVLLRGEQDELADLNLRSTVGAGYGRQFYETEVMNLSSEIGLSYVNEDYILAPDESFPSLTLGLDYDRKFFNQALVFFNDLSINMSLEDSKDTLVKNKAGVRFPLADGLNISTQFNVDYDNQPAVGAEKTDTSLIFSVGYGF